MANYSLRDNPLTEDPNDKLAQLEGVRSFTKEEIIERILKHGNTMTRTDLLSAADDTAALRGRKSRRSKRAAMRRQSA